MGLLQVTAVVLHELKEEILLFSRDSIVVYAQQTGTRIIPVELEEQLVVLECSVEATLLPEDVDQLEETHEEAARGLVVYDIPRRDVFPQEYL